MGKMKELEINRENLKNQLIEIYNKIQDIYNTSFDNNSEIQKWIIDLGNSKDYQFNEEGNTCQKFRIDLKDYKDVIDYLDNYLIDKHYCYLEIDTDCIISQGSNDDIIINHDGDIFQEHDCIIKKDDYSNDHDRNGLIESHMDKEGCYPSVFLCDYYSNLTHINTNNI